MCEIILSYRRHVKQRLYIQFQQTSWKVKASEREFPRLSSLNILYLLFVGLAMEKSGTTQGTAFLPPCSKIFTGQREVMV